MTLKEIAEKVGSVSPSTVRRYTVIPKYGINGFKSYTEYLKSTIRYRQMNPSSKSLSKLVIEGLEELDISCAELARRLGVSREVVSKYAQGKTMPRKEVFERMCEVFRRTYNTLDEVLRRHYRLVA